MDNYKYYKAQELAAMLSFMENFSNTEQRKLSELLITDRISSVAPKEAYFSQPEPVGKKKAQWKQEKQFYKRK